MIKRRFNFFHRVVYFFHSLTNYLQTKYLIKDFPLSNESGNIYLTDTIYFYFIYVPDELSHNLKGFTFKIDS